MAENDPHHLPFMPLTTNRLDFQNRVIPVLLAKLIGQLPSWCHKAFSNGMYRIRLAACRTPGEAARRADFASPTRLSGSSAMTDRLALGRFS